MIEFVSRKKNFTRSDYTSSAAAALLGNRFCVYGEKSNGEQPVFPSYSVLYSEGSTVSPTGWNYYNLAEYPNQYVRYWDNDADCYKFVAWSASAASVSNVSLDGFDIDITSKEQLSSAYVSDRVTVLPDNFGNVVTLRFRNLMTKVRIAFYETVPGYKVSDVVFRYASTTDKPLGTQYSDNCIMDGSFNNFTSGSLRISYTDASDIAQTSVTGQTPVSFYDFGSLDRGFIGESSSTPTWVNGTDAYSSVIPNEDNASPMKLVVNFTLTAEDGNDIIRVKGASVTVPQSFMVWKPNFAYTYIFKITKETNGTTGNDPDNPDPNDNDDPNKPKDPTGLYPIVFDATVVDFEDNEITTYTNIDGTENTDYSEH